MRVRKRKVIKTYRKSAGLNVFVVRSWHPAEASFAGTLRGSRASYRDLLLAKPLRSGTRSPRVKLR